MPIKPRPFTFECEGCGWTKTVAPRSDALCGRRSIGTHCARRRAAEPSAARIGAAKSALKTCKAGQKVYRNGSQRSCVSAELSLPCLGVLVQLCVTLHVWINGLKASHRQQRGPEGIADWT